MADAPAENAQQGGGKTSKYAPQVVAALVATLGGFSLGTVIGWNAPASYPIAQMFYDGDMKKAEYILGWTGSIMPLGACTAMVLMALIVDRIGRKVVMLGLAFPFILSWLILAFWAAIPALLIGRFLSGLCGGSFCVVAPIYIGEIAQKEIRGTLGVFFQLLLVIGILYSFALGLLRRLDFLSYMNIIPNVLFIILMIFMPESPMYLLGKEKKDAAKVSLQWFRGKNTNIDAELEEMEESVRASKERKGTLKDMFKQKASKKATATSLLLMFCQQLSGINIVMFYATDIFRDAKTGLNEDLSTVILGLSQVFATVVAAVLIDRVGRRILLIISHAGMGVCLAVLGVYFHMKEREMEAAANIGWLAVLCTCVYLLSFSLGSGPIPWAMLGELFPAEIKGIAGSFCSFVNWMLAFVVTKTFYDIRNAINSDGCYWLYAAFCFTGTVLIFFFVIETKNKTLEEIQREFGGGTAGGETEAAG
ncbi:facilitated trehalose transporter Tret1-2 homolog [Anabrus simplex]|uniref:facilitated trehalose transporter Tret1-2 homolog n=1 Tax=Anabrus simplex TaxID=316456 RepID=UPI0035A3805A